MYGKLFIAVEEKNANKTVEYPPNCPISFDRMGTQGRSLSSSVVLCEPLIQLRGRHRSCLARRLTSLGWQYAPVLNSLCLHYRPSYPLAQELKFAGWIHRFRQFPGPIFLPLRRRVNRPLWESLGEFDAARTHGIVAFFFRQRVFTFGRVFDEGEWKCCLRESEGKWLKCQVMEHG